MFGGESFQCWIFKKGWDGLYFLMNRQFSEKCFFIMKHFAQTDMYSQTFDLMPSCLEPPATPGATLSLLEGR